MQNLGCGFLANLFESKVVPRLGILWDKDYSTELLLNRIIDDKYIDYDK